MPLTRLSWFALLASVVAVAVPQGAQAQLGGLIKKKVNELTKPPVAAPAKPTYDNPDVLTITEPVLVALEKGLKTEVALREAFETELAAMKTQPQYQQCQMDALGSDAGQKFSESLSAAAEKENQDERTRLMTKLSSDMQAFLLKQCGEDPGKLGAGWKVARLKEIQLKAAAAAGPIHPGGPGEDSIHGPWLSGESDEANQIQEGMTLTQYLILQERVMAYCKFMKNLTAKDPVDPKEGEGPTPDGGLKIGGYNGKFYVYSEEESKLLQRYCTDLMNLMEKTH